MTIQLKTVNSFPWNCWFLRFVIMISLLWFGRHLRPSTSLYTTFRQLTILFRCEIRRTRRQRRTRWKPAKMNELSQRCCPMSPLLQRKRFESGRGMGYTSQTPQRLPLKMATHVGRKQAESNGASSSKLLVVHKLSHLKGLSAKYSVSSLWAGIVSISYSMST